MEIGIGLELEVEELEFQFNYLKGIATCSDPYKFSQAVRIRSQSSQHRGFSGELGYRSLSSWRKYSSKSIDCKMWSVFYFTVS